MSTLDTFKNIIKPFNSGDRIIVSGTQDGVTFNEEPGEITYKDKYNIIVKFDRTIEDISGGKYTTDNQWLLNHFCENIKIDYELPNTDDRFEKWEECKINEEYDYESNKFNMGDRVIVSGTKNNITFNTEPGEILYIDENYLSIQFDRRIKEISNGKFDGHRGWFNKGKSGHCWEFYTDLEKMKIEHETPDDDRFEKWEEKINENNDYFHLKNKFNDGDRIIFSGTQNNITFNEEPGKIIHIDSDILNKLFSIQFDRSIYDISNGEFFGHSGWSNKGKSGHCWEIYNSCKNLKIEHEVSDDRFEKWEENINEEYDYESNKFKVGDRVIIKDYNYFGEFYIKYETGKILEIKELTHSSLIIGIEFDKNFYEVSNSVVDGHDCRGLGKKLHCWHFVFNKKNLGNNIILDQPLDDRFEKWEEKVNENKFFLELKNKFDIGDRIILSGKQDGAIFNEEPGKIIYIANRYVSIQFDRTLEEITNGIAYGHSGGKNIGEKGYCWNMFNGNEDFEIEHETPDDDRFEKWEEKVNENNNFPDFKKHFKVGDRIILSGKQEGVEFNEEPGEITYIDQNFMSVQFDRSIYEMSGGRIRGHYGYESAGKDDFWWHIDKYCENLKIEYEQPLDLDDRFEKWEEKINEENKYELDRFNVGDRIVLLHNNTEYFGTIVGKYRVNIYNPKTLEPSEPSDISQYSVKLDNKQIPIKVYDKGDNIHLEDRFEKWEEKVNEEYDYKNNNFEVGDRVVLNNQLKKDQPFWCKNYSSGTFDEIGVISEVLSNGSVRVYFENKDRTLKLLPKWIDLNEEPLDDRFEKWEE